MTVGGCALQGHYTYKASPNATKWYTCRKLMSKGSRVSQIAAQKAKRWRCKSPRLVAKGNRQFEGGGRWNLEDLSDASAPVCI